MKFKIYQLKEIKNCDYAFMNWEFAETHGFKMSDYEEVYSGEREQKHILSNLFEEFNLNHPADFRGRSMSVSDVVALKKDGNDYWYWYYVDAIGWKEITGRYEFPEEN